MKKLLSWIFGGTKKPKWKCTYCQREFDKPEMAKICHDLDLKIAKYGAAMVEEIKEKTFSDSA